VAGVGRHRLAQHLVACATVRVLAGHRYYVPAFHYLIPFYSP
jgi:hypothetical protein